MRTGSEICERGDHRQLIHTPHKNFKSNFPVSRIGAEFTL